MTATVVEQYNFDSADNTLPVLASDLTAVYGTDFIFDSLNPATWGGTLPSVGLVPQGQNFANVGGILLPSNLAPVVAGAEITTTLPPYFDGKGIVFNPSSSPVRGPLKITRVGTVNNRVGEPSIEGFASHLIICWTRPGLPASSRGGIFGAGQYGGSVNPYWGFQIDASGTIYELMTGNNIVTGVTTSPLVQIAAYYAFNTVANTTSVTTYFNGQLVATAAGTAPASISTSNSNAACTIARINGGTDFTGTIYRAEREIITAGSVAVAASGRTPLAVVQANYAANLSRYT